MVLKIDNDTVKLQKVTYDVINITSPKMRHQNYVTKFSIFKPLNPGCALAYIDTSYKYSLHNSTPYSLHNSTPHSL